MIGAVLFRILGFRGSYVCSSYTRRFHEPKNEIISSPGTMFHLKPLSKMRLIGILLCFILMPFVPGVANAKPLERVATGDNVSITDGAEGRVVAAGWRVDVEQGVYKKDILSVGANITLNPEQALAPVYAFGQKINLNGHFKKALAVAGQEINLAPGAISEGEVWLSGNRVWIKGDMRANGKILAQRVIIEGRVLPVKGERLEIQTKELEILQSAEVLGDIVYRGQAEPRIYDGATVKGQLTHDDETFEDELKEQLKKIAFIGQLGSKLMLLVWLLAAGLIISTFMAPKMVASTKRVRNRPLKMMGAGLVYLVAVPIVSVFLLISVIGMPVGISMMASYPVAIIMGFSIGVLWLGMLMFELILRRRPTRRHQLLGSYFMAMPVVIAITQIPYIGALGWLIPLCAGLGALTWLKYQQMQAGKE